ncbi:MAG: DUF7681 family protein, partial [Giesbergeria sp.]
LKTAIERRLEYRILTPGQSSRINHVRDAAKALGRMIDLHTPSCREQELALARLEECLMWANKAIAQEEDPK